MSADTRLTLAHLTGLFASAVDLIQRDSRDPKMTQRLARTFQLYKENRLGEVFPANMDSISLEVGSKLCDLLIREHFSAEAAAYCRERGLEFVGELFYVKLDDRTDKGRKKAASLLRRGMQELGFTMNEDPINGFGWKPPYWGTSRFLELLSLPIIDKSVQIQYSSDLSLLRNM
jgi:hypothetical protein